MYTTFQIPSFVVGYLFWGLIWFICNGDAIEAHMLSGWKEQKI